MHRQRASARLLYGRSDFRNASILWVSPVTFKLTLGRAVRASTGRRGRRRWRRGGGPLVGRQPNGKADSVRAARSKGP